MVEKEELIPNLINEELETMPITVNRKLTTKDNKKLNIKSEFNKIKIEINNFIIFIIEKHMIQDRNQSCHRK